MADSIESVLKEVAKQFGEGSARILSSTDELDIFRVSSGSLNLDMALGGGLPIGRTLEFFGPESGGKTTIALLHAAEMQKKFPKKYIVFIDLEHSLDPTLVAAYGINEDYFIVCQPDFGEQAFDIAETFIRSGTCCLIIMDSVSALLSKSESEESAEKQSVGLQARLMSKALRKITPICSANDCTFLFINQIREKVGVMYGNPETTSGGRSLPFYASIRINIRPGEKIPDPQKKDEYMGHIVNVRVVKNKTARPFRTAAFPLIYGVGVDKVAEVVDIAVLAGAIDKGGAWFKIKDAEGKPITRKVIDNVSHENGDEAVVKETIMSFQGRDKVVDYVRTDPGLYALLERVVYGGTVTAEEYAGIAE